MNSPLKIHTDAISEGEQVLLVDDLIATGGTALAAAALLRQLGGSVIGSAFVIDLPVIGGAERLQRAGLKPFSLCAFEGE